jgi:hypothetical protein
MAVSNASARAGFEAAAPRIAAWMSVAFATAAALAAVLMARFGVDRAGAELGLRMTARLAFLFFWPSYAGGALVSVFGAVFEPVRRRSRALGLSFASVLAVHLALVGWISWIGATPSTRTFAIFGVGAVWAGLLALFSIPGLANRIGQPGWWVLSNVGMNYLLFDFAFDFFKPPTLNSHLLQLEYLPFQALVSLGAGLRLIAWLKRVTRPTAPGP